MCYSNLDIRGKTSHSTPMYKILNASGECIQEYNLLNSEHQSESEICPSGLLSVDLSPLASPQTTDTLPHVQLNISIMSHYEVSAIFVRLHCLHAPDSEDVYCHDSSRMVVDGIWRWPCRGILLDSQVDVPLVFGYGCFRLYGLSQYYVNITVFPQNCRETFLLTSPPDTQLFPSIAKFYDQKNITSFQWSPVLFVDLSESDGVWFRVSYPKGSPVRSVMIAVFDTSGKDGSVARKIDSYEILYPANGVKWLNAAQGNYSIYAYIQRHDCSLLCNRSDTSCTTCVHTQLNFTLPEDVATISWKGLRTIRDSGIGVVFLILAVCLILVVAVSTILYARRRLTRPVITDLELNEVRKIHIVYSDDCEEHSRVVMELVRFLEASNCVSVTIDQRDLTSSGIRPRVWVADSLEKADIVLIIVSPLTGVILNGSKLEQRRPYPDLFHFSYELISKELFSNVNCRKKYALLTLPYTEITPRELQVLNVKAFSIPSQIEELFLFVGNNAENNTNQLLLVDSSSALSSLNSAIKTMRHMMEQNPTWSRNRIIQEKSHKKDSVNIPLKNRKIPTDKEEYAQLCETLDLLPLEENDVEIEQRQEVDLELLARDDSSDSDSD